MARPARWADLKDHEKRGDEIVRWSYHRIMAHPLVAKHVVAAAEAAAKAGLVVDNEGIYERPTNDVLERRLAEAQKYWDDMEAKYKVAEDFSAPSSELYSINSWARDNGLPAIKPL